MRSATAFRFFHRVLVNGDGQIVTPSAAGTAPPGGTPGGPGEAADTPAGATATPFTINVTYAASVAAAPAGFMAGVQAAVTYLQSRIADPVTLNITIGFGEVAGSAMGASSLGTTLTYLSRARYGDIAAAMNRDAKSPVDALAAASLPAANPIPNATYWLGTAHARALGMAGPATGPDGYVGFASAHRFDYDRTDGIAAGTYDFLGIALHEITEVMGRTLLTGKTIAGIASSYGPMDLFQYAAPGVRDVTSVGPGYFSPDGGLANLGVFNTVAGGDAGDWGATMGNDSFNAFSAPGVVNAVSAADLAVLDAIGWDIVAPVASASAIAAPDLAGLAHSASLDTARGLAPGTPLATITPGAGPGNGTGPFTLEGAPAGVLEVVSGADAARLVVGSTGVAGSRDGALLRLRVSEPSSAGQPASPGADVALIVGTGAADAVNVKTLLGSRDTPTFLHGLAGNDTLNGIGTTSALWISGGAGADRMTGGAGANTYLYGGAADSTPRAMDVITNFDADRDLIDLTGLGVALRIGGPITAGKIAAGTVGWQTSASGTYLYVNTSARAGKLSVADMKISLQGSGPPLPEHILH